MKRTFPALALVLALLMVLTLTTACADQAAPTQPAPVQSGPAEPAPAQAAPAQATPAQPEKEVDPLVGAWKMPESIYGDDFDCFVVLNEDGSFLNATNLYESEAKTGPYTQMISTNETFKWVRVGSTTVELHYSYMDENGEFVTELTYNEQEDAFYFGTELYARRADNFELVK